LIIFSAIQIEVEEDLWSLLQLQIIKVEEDLRSSIIPDQSRRRPLIVIPFHIKVKEDLWSSFQQF